MVGLSSLKLLKGLYEFKNSIGVWVKTPRTSFTRTTFRLGGLECITEKSLQVHPVPIAVHNRRKR